MNIAKNKLNQTPQSRHIQNQKDLDRALIEALRRGLGDRFTKTQTQLVLKTAGRAFIEAVDYLCAIEGSVNIRLDGQRIRFFDNPQKPRSDTTLKFLTPLSPDDPKIQFGLYQALSRGNRRGVTLAEVNHVLQAAQLAFTQAVSFGLAVKGLTNINFRDGEIVFEANRKTHLKVNPQVR